MLVRDAWNRHRMAQSLQPIPSQCPLVGGSLVPVLPGSAELIGFLGLVSCANHRFLESSSVGCAEASNWRAQAAGGLPLVGAVSLRSIACANHQISPMGCARRPSSGTPATGFRHWSLRTISGVVSHLWLLLCGLGRSISRSPRCVVTITSIA
jgi:hypothetical protein